MNPEETLDNSIYWIELDKISPNPYQPRREFDEARLRDLADSIRQYGVLQPLVVTRQELEKDDGGIAASYELIAGERRLRASKLAGIKQVPVVIRRGDQSDKMKLELAIIENLQREDLNPVDRATAFKRLADEFKFSHTEIAKKIGRSREYVSNTIRMLGMPEEMIAALRDRKISEGHTRPILMLADQPEEQVTFFKEIILRGMSVRESEQAARRIAYHRVRKNLGSINPEVCEMEAKLADRLGTRVQIQVRNIENGAGRIFIDFFSNADLRDLLERMTARLQTEGLASPLEAAVGSLAPAPNLESEAVSEPAPQKELEKETEDDSLYSISGFTV